MPVRRLLPLAALATLATLGTGCMNEVESQPPQSRPPAIQFTAASISFEALPGGPNPAARVVTVTNAGAQTLAKPTATVAYLSGTPGWLQAVVGGTNEPYTITLTATSTGLPAAAYTAEVTVTSPGASNSPRKLPVTLTVLTPSRLVVSRSTVTMTVPVGTADAPNETVQVTNGGQQPLAVPVASVTYGSGQPAGWLAPAITGAQPPYTLTLRASSPALPAGTYSALVELASSGAANSPVGVVVELVVPRLVTVSRTLTHWGEAGSTPAVAADPDVTAVELLRDDGAGGTLRVAAAKGAAPGSWWAHLGGSGGYWILATRATGGLLYVRTAADVVDLGADLAGRAGRVRAITATAVTLGLAALDPWSTFDDTLRLTSWGAQTGFPFDNYLEPPLVPLPLLDGDVDLLGYVFDWSNTLGTLLAADDVLWLQQSRFRFNDLGSLFYQETRTWSQATGIALVDGAPAAIAAAGAQFPAGIGALRLDWRRSQFEAGLPPFAPSILGHRVALAGVPAPLTGAAPLGGVGVPLLEAPLGTTSPSDQDFDAGTLAYGRFLPAGWSELFSASLVIDVLRTAPGAATPAPDLQDAVYRFDAAAAAPNPVTPLVGGPTAPTVDGLDALAPQAGRTTTPTLAWTAPAVGAPSSYRVTLHELVKNGTASERVRVAELVVDGATTAVEVPANVLLAGRTYLAELVARTAPTDAGGATPFRTAVPFGEGVVWTAAFATAPAP